MYERKAFVCTVVPNKATFEYNSRFALFGGILRIELHSSSIRMNRVIVLKNSCILTITCFPPNRVVVVALLFYVHGKHLRSCRDGQLT